MTCLSKLERTRKKLDNVVPMPVLKEKTVDAAATGIHDVDSIIGAAAAVADCPALRWN